MTHPIRLAGVVLLACSLMLGCSDDGVPAVSDPRAIVVNGTPLTGLEFVSKYCRDKPAEKTCVSVRDALNKDVGNRPMTKGW